MQIPLCNAIPTPEFPKFHDSFERLCDEEKIDEYRIVGYCVAFASATNAVNATPTLYMTKRSKIMAESGEFARKATLTLVELGHAPHYMDA